MMSGASIGQAITSGKRRIQTGIQYDNLFPIPDKQDRIIIEDGEVNDTVTLMSKVVWKYLDDTKRLATLLKKDNLEATCRAIWDFIYTNIQYQLDKRGLEQLRRPARSWYERKTGVDCDCMSIFASSVLTNLGIPHSFRVTRYSSDYWQHVYVIVPQKSGKNLVVDGVVSEFNYEKAYADKMDFPMNLNGINVAVLSGFEGNDLYDVVLANGLSLGELDGTSANKELDFIYKSLVSTRNAIQQNPMLVAKNDDPRALIQMLDYAIQYFYTDKRNEALEILEKNESRFNSSLNLDQFMGMGDLMDLDDEVLGAIKVKNFFSSVKKAANNAGKKVGKVAKKALKAVIKFNPITMVARTGFLVAMRVNLKGMAKKLKWAYATEAEARAKGISSKEWSTAVGALAKFERLFADKLQGSKSALKKAILKGKAGGLNGIVDLGNYGLGEPISAATIAAATPIIIAGIKILKESGLFAKNVSEDPNSIASELSSEQNGSEIANDIGQSESQEEQGPQSNMPLAPRANEVATNDAPPSDNGGTPPKAGSKIITWVKANPIPTVIVVGGVGLLAYNLLSPKKPTRTVAGLSGTRAKIRTTRKKPRPTASKTKVKTILIK